ncbi:TonB-dependent receptor plug domain-containing protein [Pelagicoccus mobilis]|uniref:TonB-dependent receptor n=1 Tax=Pelagicoccus mobilis TaxID=415221 RepID=A0A934VN99_9BACT|nr:TonB-dependent receptor plug domain-containing protein [Pelagicoccus mobilis]MBK1876007.1 TonB-dependent receptor [Pelagicoccus mobilis]
MLPSPSTPSLSASLRLFCLVGILAILRLASAQPASDDLSPGPSPLSLEELANKPAIVSSRLESQVFNAPTGSFVFDEDDISNLPVDSIPEMLRYAPGVHIIRPNNGIWGLGIRGINSRFFNRALFTVDEQNVYGSIFAGLFGNQHDLLMEDVSSVEVAYGPGGGTWDNNAVNGMVNVRMKTAFETEGSLLRVNLGTENYGVAGRIGWAVNDTTSARVYAKANHRDSSFTRFPYENDWDTARAGFRIDHRPTSHDLVSISGEAFYSDLGYAYDLANFDTGDLSFVATSEKLAGGNSQFKWTRNRSNDSSYSVRSWVGYSDLDAAYAAFSTWNGGIEARGSQRFSDFHSLSANIGFAYHEEHTSSTAASDFTDRQLDNPSYYAGFQDEWEIKPEKIKFSWGLDFRHDERANDSTYSPNARFIYEIDDRSRFWLSYSQANRTPPVSLSVIESLRSGKALDAPITIPTPGGPLTIEHSLANAVSREQLDAEELDSYEFGYRVLFPENKGSFTLNAFSYKYDKLIGRVGVDQSLSLFTPTPYVDIEVAYDNLLEGDARGFEASLDWQFSPWQRARLNYSRMTDDFESLIIPENDFQAGFIAFSLDEFDNSTPKHLATLNLITQLHEDWNLDTGFRYSSDYDFAKGYQQDIFQLDARLSWQKSESLRLSLVGRNLLDPTTQEARLKDYFGHWTEMKREAYLEITAQF